MNSVVGKLILDVILPVENDTEELGLMEANYRLNPERLIGYEVYAVNCKGEQIKVNVMEWMTDLSCFVTG
jgi:hypothetical protein